MQQHLSATLTKPLQSQYITVIGYDQKLKNFPKSVGLNRHVSRINALFFIVWLLFNAVVYAADVNSNTSNTNLSGHTVIAVADLPTLNQPIIDTVNLLNSAQNQALSQQILQLYQQQTVQIGVVIVNTTADVAIFDYAMQVAEQWKLGEKGKDNGLLMLIAVQDQRVQILTGYGLEGVLPDIVIGRIIRDDLRPLFQQQQYAQGIQVAISRISEKVKAQSITPQAGTASGTTEKINTPLQKALMFALLVVVLATFASFMMAPRKSAIIAAPIAVGLGLYSGVGVFASLAIGVGVFVLVMTTLSQILLQVALQMLGGGRGSSGGGYSGGGGRFGGGGASGSW